MARWLRDIGYRPTRAGIRANVDCAEKAVGRLEAQLEAAAQRHGRELSIVGHSRGGTMARILAVRRPDLIRRIICLGSPLLDQFDVHPLVGVQVQAVAALGSLGLPGFFTRGCAEGCCVEAFDDLRADFPDDVGFTSVFSRSDGVVSWRACLDPAARQVEVSASHVGMAVNAQVYEVIAGALAGEVGRQRAGSLLAASAGSRR